MVGGFGGEEGLKILSWRGQVGRELGVPRTVGHVCSCALRFSTSAPFGSLLSTAACYLSPGAPVFSKAGPPWLLAAATLVARSTSREPPTPTKRCVAAGNTQSCTSGYNGWAHALCMPKGLICARIMYITDLYLIGDHHHTHVQSHNRHKHVGMSSLTPCTQGTQGMVCGISNYVAESAIGRCAKANNLTDQT